MTHPFPWIARSSNTTQSDEGWVVLDADFNEVVKTSGPHAEGVAKLVVELAERLENPQPTREELLLEINKLRAQLAGYRYWDDFIDYLKNPDKND